MKEELNDREVIERQRAYYNTLLGDEQGRAVLCDMMRAAGMFDIIESNCADEQLIHSNFVKIILKKCGMDDPKAVVEAYAAIAKTWRPPEPKEPDPDPLETKKDLL